jgi:ankyrin repeat protein
MLSVVWNSDLERAYEEKDLRAAQRLLEAGADPNEDLELGRVTDRAVFDERYDWADLFASYGGDFGLPDMEGMAPLHRAASQRDEPKPVRRLIQLGAPVSQRTATGWTPLHFAARYGYLRVAKALLEAGADPRATTGDGLTPRDLAARNHHDALVEYLNCIALG